MRVLVVEDEDSVAAGIRRALSCEGYAVDLATEGQAGLERARSERYDVIVLDVMLPKVSGHELCRELRADGNRTPIVMLSARGGPWDVVEGLDLGADDYLTKPFSMAVLLARVRARTRGTGTAHHTLEHGDLRLDTLLRRCWRDGVEIELTGRETTLMCELFRRGGEVSEKGELLDRVWGHDFHGDPNLVEVYIGRLRKKIDTPFSTRDIETIRGVGYRLRIPEHAGPRP